MHSELSIGESLVMVSDGMCGGMRSSKAFRCRSNRRRSPKWSELFAGAGRRRQGANADDRDVFLAAVRHGGRQVRGRVVGDCTKEVTAGKSPFGWTRRRSTVGGTYIAATRGVSL